MWLSCVIRACDRVLTHSWIEIIAECLSVRLIIGQARRALGGPYSEVVLVCMYVHNGFTIEIYGFMHTLRTF